MRELHLNLDKITTIQTYLIDDIRKLEQDSIYNLSAEQIKRKPK